MGLRRPLARGERLAGRIEALPRPPFLAAVAAAVLLLLAALATAADPDLRVAEVGMFADPSGDAAAVEAESEGAEVVILEYGFGRIELNGRERPTVGAVVHNPHPTAAASLRFEVAAAPGEPPVEAFAVHDVPPDSDALVGRTLTGDAADRAGDGLVLTLESVSFETPPPGSPHAGHLPARFTVLAIEPLLSPQGHRIVYRVDSALDRDKHVRADVVFRDADGAIVGGVSGKDRVADGSDLDNSVGIPPGASVHHFHLRSEEIPEGADLSQTEIGSGGAFPGG